MLSSYICPQKAAPPAQKTPPAPADDDDDDDDVDLFGSDDDVDEEAERLKEQRLQEYAAKKAKKPAIIAKSSILLDVKPVRSISKVYSMSLILSYLSGFEPQTGLLQIIRGTVHQNSPVCVRYVQWDDETDMSKMEECVRSIHVDGLLWGASKLVPVGYGIKKLQINCVVEDDKVGTDLLEEEITKFEDYVSMHVSQGQFTHLQLFLFQSKSLKVDPCSLQMQTG